MSHRPLNVLFLCTGNSARSILAESILGAVDPARFRAFSAGSRPVGCVNAFARELLAAKGFVVEGLRSKSWDEFAAPGAPRIDLVITVCDGAAAEPCPAWPGGPARAHWGLPDPAAVHGDDARKRLAFLDTFAALERRIARLAALRPEGADRAGLARLVMSVGEGP